MKSLRKIIPLSIASAGIIVFWLAPGINAAEGKRYTRIYEDTDQLQAVVLKTSFPAPPGDTTKSAMKKSKLNQKKKYKKESIESGTKLSKVRPSMFSRAIHFSEEVPLDSADVIPAETSKPVQLTKKIEKE